MADYQDAMVWRNEGPGGVPGWMSAEQAVSKATRVPTSILIKMRAPLISSAFFPGHTEPSALPEITQASLTTLVNRDMLKA
jgi:hypothetical protein